MTDHPQDSGLSDLPQDEGDAESENLRKFRLSRRNLLKIMGAAAVAGVAAPMVPKAIAAAAEDNPVDVETEGRRLRRWGMVIDLRKCDGCQSNGTPPQCTQGCIEGHFLPEPMEWIQVFESDMPGGGTQFIPVPCQGCQNPPCVNVCPVGATWTTPEGVTLIDQDRCIGCRMCMAACPYDRRFFNWGDPPIPPEAMFVEYHPERQTPLRKGVTSKCDFCVDMARTGRLPHCAQGCPNNAIYYGDFEEDLATNGDEVVQLSKFLSENHAYRLKEELGTKPRVHYIPGAGEEIGRDPYTAGRADTEWPWQEKLEGSKVWNRHSR